jgi:branched-chain amino acid transport system ATP-binding protein
MALLQLESITAGYGAGPDILNDVSLTIESSRTYCIIGPNGAGKSTLLKAICGLLRPRSGRVIFKDETINGLGPDQILAKGVCYVPQYQSLFPDMTVRENLVMGGYIENDRSVLKERMESAHEIFPILNERSSQRAKTLSGGEQQMLTLARAIMLRPKLLMLDEPSLGLAPRLVNQIFETIERFKSMGMTMLLVEQNARRGLQSADWGYVLDLGTNRFEGPADSILSDPRIQELYLGKQRVNQKEEKP